MSNSTQKNPQSTQSGQSQYGQKDQQKDQQSAKTGSSNEWNSNKTDDKSRSGGMKDEQASTSKNAQDARK